jgi:hypothetical protein
MLVKIIGIFFAGVLVTTLSYKLAKAQQPAALPTLSSLIAQGFEIKAGVGTSSIMVQKGQDLFLCITVNSGTSVQSQCYPVK